ncbi:hypothetical protein FRC06_003592 [Ceratobasidium sp. 370]|nr:hypothetical protein FRC06_003592 [Ceratobasidium sp. 370]
MSSLEEMAESLVTQLNAALRVFELHVIPLVLKTMSEVCEKHAEQVRRQLLPTAPYHLVVLFLTESDPRGGWWVASETDPEGPRRANEGEFIVHHTRNLEGLAKDALTARLFAISCGLNMFNEDVLGDIFHTVDRFATVALNHSTFRSFDPALAVHWDFPRAIRPSLLLRSAARKLTPSYMGQVTGNKTTYWVYIDGTVEGRKRITLCAKVRTRAAYHPPFGLRVTDDTFAVRLLGQIGSPLVLHIAIYTDNRAIFKAHGTTIMEEVWDLATERFTFDPATMVTTRMSRSRKGTDLQKERPTHDTPWTIAGQQARMP